MPPLNTDLRRQLENVIIDAREKAEEAAASALKKLAVDAAEPFGHFDADKRQRRNRLRARGRQVGDVRHPTNKTQGIDHLTQELAYEYWHRMLFARFLVENDLLVLPDGTKIDLDDCKELAPTEGAANEYVLAARYASQMLPQIFRTDDVLLEIEFPNEQRLPLERLLEDLPSETFRADDGLGWVYQFWQARRKKEVNDSGAKIDGTTLPAVTQLFTEHYMVQFLLHNTIGAWWCGRHGIKGPADGAGVLAGQAPVEMEYVRWKDDGTPAAGTFPGWPKSLREFTLLDPCCGSGHFLVAAFNLLVPLRMAEEGLSAADACDAVLKGNLFGLELDPRCTQIAAFALALAAWKYPDAGGHRELPPLNIACSGQGVTGKRDEWLALANGDAHLQAGMDRLYDLFEKAPHLGSLIAPGREHANLAQAGYAELRPLVEHALAGHASDADLHAVGVAARGITAAADLLARRYTLVITNVPYLGRGKQADVVKEYLEEHHDEGKADLATAFVLRCLELCKDGGSTALVTPQNWLFQTGYKKLRTTLLKTRTWNVVARLGPRAFETITGEVVNVALLVLTATAPLKDAMIVGMDVTDAKTAVNKADELAGREPTSIQLLRQKDQSKNPDAIVGYSSTSAIPILSTYASSFQGLCTSDDPQFIYSFWELDALSQDWKHIQSAAEASGFVGGCSSVLYWQEGTGRYSQHAMALKKEGRLGGWKSGGKAWGKKGIAVNVTSNIYVNCYLGDFFDNTIAAIIPQRDEDLTAIFEYMNSSEYRDALSDVSQALSITEHTLLKVPFDLARWQAVAAEKYPLGLPEPHSNDPTQWLFKGDIASSTDPLQVAVARLLGYRWPDQSSSPDAVAHLADDDGIVCLPRVRGEAPADERLREVLAAAYGETWSEAKLTELLAASGAKATATLTDWLAGSFFEQHSKRFDNRPFIWHIWDGRKGDGFSALLNYHKLNYKTLENLTYSYLNDWITAQTTDARAGKVGADLRLAAAQQLQEKLKLILAGEPPYDIFVRWKPLSEQPVGWNPDLNDGVRQNIRPFVKAGVLRKDLKGFIKESDRGNEPKRDKDQFPWFWAGNEPNVERVNNVHLTTAQKQAARDKLKAKGTTP